MGGVFNDAGAHLPAPVVGVPHSGQAAANDSLCLTCATSAQLWAPGPCLLAGIETR